MKKLVSATLVVVIAILVVAPKYWSQRTPASMARVENLGTFSFKKEVTFWITDWIEFEIPENIMAFTLTGISEDNLVQVTDLVDPNGNSYVTANGDSPLHIYSDPIMRNVISPNRSVAVTPGTLTLLVPNNPSLPKPAAGKWRMRILSQQAPKDKQITLWLKTRSTAGPSILPVKVFVKKDSFWLEQKQRVPYLLSEAEKTLSAADVKLKIESIEIIDDVAINKPLDVPVDVAKFAKTNNDPNVLNIYLLGTMIKQSKPVNGLACLAGPIGLPIQHTCFASMYAGPEAAKYPEYEYGRILAHELGHYFGLFHTIDTGYPRVKQVTDPFSDTKEAITGENLMDPGVHNEHPELSAEQIKLIQGSPVGAN